MVQGATGRVANIIYRQTVPKNVHVNATKGIPWKLMVHICKYKGVLCWLDSVPVCLVSIN